MNGLSMQGAYVNIPSSDWRLFKELVRKMGWQVQTREDLLDSFIKSRPAKSPLSEDEIMDEVKAVRITADYIVSGDKDLTDLECYQQTKILKLTEFKDTFSFS